MTPSAEATVAHDPLCTGHHCCECGECLLYDPADPENRWPGESPIRASVCCDCEEEE